MAAIIVHHDPSVFAALATPVLSREEAKNCMALGFLDMLVADSERFSIARLISLSGAAGLEGIAWTVPSHALGLSAMPARAVEALVEYAASRFDEGVCAVAGPKPAVIEFKDRWLGRRGGSVQKGMDQRIYRLERVTHQVRSPGSLRTAVVEDEGLVVDWSLAFVADCGLDDDEESVRRAVASHLSQGCRVLWEFEREPVSMAGFGGKTPSGIRINWVYTPPRLRNRGYASALVAALSADLLARGRKWCFLYTDLGNPTSNRIYQRIGYRPVCEAAYYSFAE